MQRIVIPAVLTIFAFTPASAGPLDPSLQSQPDTAFAQVFAAPPPAPARTAQAAMQGPNYGGGFFEMLFAAPGRQQAAPRYYAPAPAMMPPPEQRLPPAYYRSQPNEPQGLGSALLEQPAQQGRRSIDPKFMPQEVSYDGNEKAGTVIIK